MKTIEQLLEHLNTAPNEMTFEEVMAAIEANYDFTPCAFSNGNVENSAEQNQGSCKLFAFAKLNDLDQQQTLALFAQHYQSVLEDPEGEAHQNIRQFMANGWSGVELKGTPLTKKS